MFMRCTSYIFTIYLNEISRLKLSDAPNVIVNLLTSNRKSPGFKPDRSATPPGSTSSKYCSPGQRSDGLSCISGDAALAPRNTNPNPLLARCRITVLESEIPLKRKRLVVSLHSSKIVSYFFLIRGPVELLYCNGTYWSGCCICCFSIMLFSLR